MIAYYVHRDGRTEALDAIDPAWLRPDSPVRVWADVRDPTEADGRVLRMSALAARTNATLPRLSHVVRKMAERGLVRRTPDPQDGRSVLVHLTEEGYAVLVAAAPGHVDAVRRYVFDRLDDEQVSQLGAIADAMLDRLDPEGALTHEYRRPADPGRPAG